MTIGNGSYGTSSSGAGYSITTTTHTGTPYTSYPPPPLPLKLDIPKDPLDLNRVSYVADALEDHQYMVSVSAITGDHSYGCTCGESFDPDVQGGYALHMARIALEASDTWDMGSMDGSEDFEDFTEDELL